MLDYCRSIKFTILEFTFDILIEFVSCAAFAMEVPICKVPKVPMLVGRSKPIPMKQTLLKHADPPLSWLTRLEHSHDPEPIELSLFHFTLIGHPLPNESHMIRRFATVEPALH